jgi:VanZ family protein
MVRAGLIITATLAIAAYIARETLTPSSGGPPTLPFTDKQLHAMAFGLLLLPTALLAPRAMLMAAPLALIYGGLIEVIQPYVGRTGEWADLLADGVGIAAACVLALIVVALRRKA